MKEEDFVAAEAGELVLTPFGVKAFVPANLPPFLDMNRLAMPLADAMQAIGELKGASRRLTNPYVLVRPLQRQEALTSSAMEGTFTTDDNLLLAEAGLQSKTDTASIEVRNYLSALKESVSMLQDDGVPISHRLLKQAHGTLLAGVGSFRGANRKPGEYKSDQNAIGGTRIERARFVPPPPAIALKCMDSLEAFINRVNRTNSAGEALIDIALAHYQLETIHPFADGNGRVGRMLISLMAVERQLFDMPLLYVSPAMEKEKDKYIDLMYNVSSKGEWEEWIEFFLEIVRISAANTIKTIDRLIDLQAEYRKLVSDEMRTSNGLALVDQLFEEPVLTIPRVQKILGVTYRSAKNICEKLLSLNILTEIPNSHPRLLVAWRVITIASPPK